MTSNVNRGQRMLSYFNRRVLLVLAVVIFVAGALAGDMFANAGRVPYGRLAQTPFYQKVIDEYVPGNKNFKPLDVPMSPELQEYIYYLSTGFNIDYTFVMAVIQTESTFRPNLISPTNDYGLMQINKINHAALTDAIGVTDFLDPYENAYAGVWILYQLFTKYEDPGRVLMAYNIGENGARLLWRQGIYQTNYVRKVLRAQDVLAAQVER